jgi:hypothetical protein
MWRIRERNSQPLLIGAVLLASALSIFLTERGACQELERQIRRPQSDSSRQAPDQRIREKPDQLRTKPDAIRQTPSAEGLRYSQQRVPKTSPVEEPDTLEVPEGQSQRRRQPVRIPQTRPMDEPQNSLPRRGVPEFNEGLRDPPAATCLIATAAYGSPLAENIAILENFRDRFLLTRSWGRRFVDLYYRHSPPVAAFVSQHETARFFTRILLWPLVLGIKHPLQALSLFLFLVVSILVCARVRRRSRKH